MEENKRKKETITDNILIITIVILVAAVSVQMYYTLKLKEELKLFKKEVKK